MSMADGSARSIRIGSPDESYSIYSNFYDVPTHKPGEDPDADPDTDG